ncbi:16825_t:CDS:2 [Acaulospora colombiana]|uniref:16825_t:CDS:1 n=1 Tax=Acaulospora colombiana TaxID=27376 RepID=A0ACA9LRX0_9GLOM|nr:16825_t:CDS:2 [Acaulospora colombiana]
MGAPTKETSSENTIPEDSNPKNTVSTETTGSSRGKKRITTHRISLGDVTPNNLGQLKRLNSVLFPVNYSERFYKDVLEVGEFAKLGTTLLSHILNNAAPGAPPVPKFTEIYLHVQTSNEEALAFYKKYDFQIVGTVEGYYKKITPPDAYVLSRKLVND